MASAWPACEWNARWFSHESNISFVVLIDSRYVGYDQRQHGDGHEYVAAGGMPAQSLPGGVEYACPQGRLGGRGCGAATLLR